MGRISKELKELGRKKEKEWPVDGQDYYILRVKADEVVPAGWTAVFRKKTFYTREKIIALLKENKKPEAGMDNRWYTRYYFYPGPKPDKRWGPVSP